MGNKTKIVGGPITVLYSTTTMGETLEGFTIRGTAIYDEVKTHESGPVPVMVSQQGGRRWELEITELEVGTTNLARLFQDATQSGTTIEWQAAQANKILTDITLTCRQKDAKGTIHDFVFNNMVPAPDGIELIGRVGGGDKWKFNCKWIGLWDSATMALISNLTA